MSIAAQILAPAGLRDCADSKPVGGRLRRQYSQYFTLTYELSSFPRFYMHAAVISV
jgi:hypothetical protein